MELSLILCTLTSLAVAFGIAWGPLVKMKQATYFTADAEPHRFDPKLALLEAIAELEQDFTLGHLEHEEFETLSLELKREFLESQTSPEQI